MGTLSPKRRLFLTMAPKSSLLFSDICLVSIKILGPFSLDNKWSSINSFPNSLMPELSPFRWSKTSRNPGTMRFLASAKLLACPEIRLLKWCEKVTKKGGNSNSLASFNLRILFLKLAFNRSCSSGSSSSICSLLKRSSLGLYTMFGAMAITVYWPIVGLSTVFYAKGSPGWHFTDYTSYSILLSLIAFYGLWGFWFLYKKREVLVKS